MPARLTLRASVVVPAHAAAADLAACIDALERSDLDRESWELIVVDDASPAPLDGANLYRADSLIRIENDPRGPAFARNRGAEQASADIVVFVDADVEVHSDALSRMVESMETDESVSAVIGSYDSAPPHGGIVSRYRNLLHHYVHQRSAGNVESFWAGCGAVRAKVFNACGGFDETRFTRPEIEDVELGYRLRDVGHRIVLDPRVLCTHRKRWTLAGMVKTDFARRGVPWTRLLLERKMLLSPRGLSLGASERLSLLLAVAAVVVGIAAAPSRSITVAATAAVALATFVIVNRDLLGWLNRERGIGFAISAIPLHLLYNLVALSAVGWGTVLHLVSGRRERRRYKSLR